MNFHSILYSILAIVLVQCGNDTGTAGNTTTTTTGISATLLYEAKPIQGAQVIVRPIDYNPLNGNTKEWQIVSQENGAFTLAFTDTNTNYSLQILTKDSTLGYWEGNLATACQFDENHPSNPCELGTIELQSTITTHGVVQMNADTNSTSPKDSSLQIQIGLQGTNYLTHVDSFGNYSFAHLPPGDYQLQIWNSYASHEHSASLLSQDSIAIAPDSKNIGVKIVGPSDRKIIQIDSLIGWWALEDTVNGILADWSGNNNYGDFWREPHIIQGMQGNALYTTEGSDFLNLATASNPNFHFRAAQDFTICMFIKSDAALDTMTILNKEAAGLTRIQLQLLPTGHLEFFARQYINIDYGGISESTIEPNVWYHIAFGRQQEELFLYINGVEQMRFDNGIYVENMNLIDGDLRIGTNRVNEQRFVGGVDEIMIFRKALSATEIQWLQN
jgi:hypothetical protein